MWSRLKLLLIVALLQGTALHREVSSAKILSLAFISSKSHKIIYEPLLHKLAERGHEVTIVNPIKSTKSLKNVRNIQLYDPEAQQSSSGGLTAGMPNVFEKRAALNDLTKYLENPFLHYYSMFESGCRQSYENREGIESLKRENFDLIIFTPLFNDCVYGLLHELNTTVIAVSQVAVMPWVAGHMGSPTLPSFVPLLFYGLTDDMNFWERTLNFLGFLYFEGVRRFYYNPGMESIYREYVNPNAPSIDDIARERTSMVLVNSHISFVPPRPLMPDIVEVGGMHLREAQPLPEDLQAFCDGAAAAGEKDNDDGFILFSMGSWVQSSSMPPKFLRMFLGAFSKLRQRVIWKWETESLPQGVQLPQNVMLSKWLPQPDILGHKNIRLFITHGGHGGTTEALYEGVPLLGIPMFGDQHWNMKQAVSKGFALSLDLAEMTEEKLSSAINRILNEPQFSEKAKLLSKVYRDHLTHPLDKAVYSVEYVLRYGGAPHLRSAARNLNFLQYFSLDVILFLALALLLIFYIFFKLIVLVFKYSTSCFRNNNYCRQDGKTKNLSKKKRS